MNLNRVAKEGWYFIGIGGVSMSALALLLHDRGIPVRGSDAKDSEYTDKLRKRGIPVSIGEKEEITEQNVVYTGAIENTNTQLCAAKAAGKRLIPRAECLGKIASEYPFTVSVAGCHGKTSTTAMLSHIFLRAERAFTCHIGGEDSVLGNFYSSATETEHCFITEACEFQRSFLSLHSSVAVILNTDKDHTDCYRDEQELVAAYRQFAEQAEKVVVNADDLNARDFPHALSFGFYAGDIRADRIRAEREKYSFTVTERGISVVRIRLNVVGKFQIANALAAYAAARLSGLSASEIKCGLEDFRGVKRRFEEVGTLCGIPVICDYAHHPREISATLTAAQKICEGTVRLVFQPHTYTRTRDLVKEFLAVLKKAENPVIYRTFAAREPFDFSGSAVVLTSRLPEASYVQSPEQLKKRLTADLKPEDLILVLGAGNIYETACSIVDPKTV